MSLTSSQKRKASSKKSADVLPAGKRIRTLPQSEESTSTETSARQSESTAALVNQDVTEAAQSSSSKPSASTAKYAPSSSDSDDTDISDDSLAESLSSIESDDDENDNGDASGSSTARATKLKRHDPAVFASSINAILNSKLTTSKRADPVLSRSKSASEAGQALADARLDKQARRHLRDEKRRASEKGRVRNVLLGDKADANDSIITAAAQSGPSAADIAAQEKRLRKTAQRGVIKLFNAVRAAQVRGEEEERRQRENGIVGAKHREEKVGEMGRQAFLDLVGAGGEAR